MKDANTLPASYDAWLNRAEKVESDLKRQGHFVVRAIIDPDKFAIWCDTNGLNIDTNARTRWANEFAYRSITKAN